MDVEFCPELLSLSIFGVLVSGPPWISKSDNAQISQSAPQNLKHKKSKSLLGPGFGIPQVMYFPWRALCFSLSIDVITWLSSLDG